VRKLQYGDFDPSGLDMTRDLERRLRDDHNIGVDMRRVALNPAQCRDWNLRPDPAKTTDSRASRFIAEYGSVSSVELDAIEPALLVSLIQDELEGVLNMDALRAERAREEQEQAVLRDALLAAYATITLPPDPNDDESD
jgi:hypothetical protein